MAYTAIDDPSAYFKVQLYTGTGSSTAFAFDDTDTDMQPDLVWLKIRADDTHNVYDSVRGAQKRIETSTNDAEATDSNGLTAFGSDGFTLGSGNQANPSSGTAVAWCWKESATAGFDIVSYTGNSTDDTDISHNLSAVPHLIIVKNRATADDWQVYHSKNTAAPETDYLVLNAADASVDAADRWSDEAPTSSVFTLGDGDEVNTNAEAYIAYAFAPKQGYSKFGSYLGNGNADGTFVFLGFRPAFVLIKGPGSTNWHIYDDQRLGYNVDNNMLRANLSAEEQTDDDLDLLSNGFKIRRNTSALATDGGNYVYAAFAKAPIVNSNGVPVTAR